MNNKKSKQVISQAQITIIDVNDGENPKSVKIDGITNFVYENRQDNTPTPESITLTAILDNFEKYKIKWQYKVSGTSNFIDVLSNVGCELLDNNLKLKLDDKACFKNILTEFKVIVTDTSVKPNVEYSATHSIGKVYSGLDAYTCVLTNESDTILFNQDNTVKPGQIGSHTSKSLSTIMVRKGDLTLQGVAQTVTPSLGQFKFKFEPAPINCTAKRYGESSFYLDTITQNANNGKISISIYLEGNTNKITKEYTWNKVIDGINAKYLIIEGEDKFKYDNLDDKTPTPKSIVLTATAYNIPNAKYKWQYNNGVLTDIISQEGCLINNNKLTINDKKLFGNGLNSTRIICSTTYDEVTYSDSKSIIKVYDGEQGPIGPIGPTGKPSKSVTISGGSSIHYDKNNKPSPTSIKLTATSYNYEKANYKWYYKTSSGYNLISGKTNSTLDISHNSSYFIDDIGMFKVECRETNGTDLSFYEHSISRTYDGEDSTSLTLNIINGTRNLCYNGKGKLVSTIIDSFKMELYENTTNVTSTADVRSITWSAKGHYSHSTSNVGSISFKPTPISNYDESKLDTSVSLIVNYKGRIIKQTVPVTVSKNSTALDWVEEWDGSKVEIGGNYIITPKLFAGKKNTQKNTITGVALGQDIVNKNNNIGMAIYNDNKLIGKINADPSVDNNKMLVFGANPDQQFILYSDGRLEIGGNLKITSSTTTTLTEMIQNTTNNKNSINNIQIGGRNLLKKSDINLTTSSYLMKNLYFGNIVPVEGEEVTITLKGNLGKGKVSFGIYNSGGNIHLCSLGESQLRSDGIYKQTFKWKIKSNTTTASNTHISIYALNSSVTAESFIEWVKLEKGNKPTDFTLAPEDIDEILKGTEQNLNNNLDSAISAAQNNILNSLKDKYAIKEDIIALSETFTSSIETTSKDITTKFESALEYAQEVNGELQEYKNTMHTYIRESAAGIEIGKSNSPFKTLLSNTKLSFSQNNEEVAYIQYNKLNITNAEIKDTLRLGKSGKGFFTWVQNSNGNLGLKWSDS